MRVYWLFLRGLVLNTVTWSEWLDIDKGLSGKCCHMGKLKASGHSSSLVHSKLVFHWRTPIGTL